MAGLDTYSFCGNQAVIVPVSTVDPMALRPCLSAGLPLVLDSYEN